MSPLRIYGAGMAGLLTATILRRHRPVVYEAQPELPDNHGALLRFRTSAVMDATDIHFKTVQVHKAIRRGPDLVTTPSLRDGNLYSQKVTGEVLPRSVLDLAPVDRYIAPDNFLTELARDAILKMGQPLTPEILADLRGQTDVVAISTIPMPVLMKMVNWHEVPEFRWQPVWSLRVDILLPRVSVFQTIYYPEPVWPQYRASITGHSLIIEFMRTPDDGERLAGLVAEILEDFGLPSDARLMIHPARRQEYGKLLPLPEKERQTFILAMTDEYNLYSVGRFATWRQILLDDVVPDIRRIETWITQRSSYQRRLDGAGD